MSLIKKELTEKSGFVLEFSVDADVYAKAEMAAYKKMVKKIRVDGFRPGKLPKSSFIKRFGYESLYEEAVNFAINDTYPQAIQENKVACFIKIIFSVFNRCILVKCHKKCLVISNS